MDVYIMSCELGALSCWVEWAPNGTIKCVEGFDDEEFVEKLQPEHHLVHPLRHQLGASDLQRVGPLRRRAARAWPDADVAGRGRLLLALDRDHHGELAVRVPATADVRDPDELPDSPGQPR